MKLMPIIGILATAGLLAGCSASAQPAEADNTLVYLQPNTFTSLYPPAAGYYPNGGVVNQITDRLLYQDPETLELQPWIATALPEINADATEYTFDIRTDVTYSDGTPLTAENVVKNFDLYGKGDKSRTLTVSEQINNYDFGEVVDEDTVRFHFTAPSPGFAQATSSYNAGLLSDATLDLSNEGFAPGKATQIIGSGPFVIAEEKLGTELLIKAREDYDWAPPSLEHQGRAYLDGVRYILAQEESVRVGGLVAGQADIARQIEAPVERHLTDQGLTVASAPTNGVNNHLSFRFGHPLLQDIRVRQALIHGIDREEIIRTLFSDSYPLATSILASTALGYVDQGDAYTYDQELSSSLLDEAGWTERGADGIRIKDGQRLSLNVNEALPQPRSREVITKIQEQLARIGVEITLNPGDQATQTADSADLNKVQIRHSMVGRADLDVIKSKFAVDNRNALRNTNPETGQPFDTKLEALLNTVASSPSQEARLKAVADVQAYLTEQAYVLPLFEEPQVYGLQPYVHGFETESIGRPWFYNTSLEEK